MFMTRVFQIVLLGTLALWAAGCNSSETKPIWERIKITDLAPIDNNKQGSKQRLKTINFKVYVFEIPSEDISKLDEVWPMLYTQTLQFNDQYTFSGNSFMAGFGKIPMWGKIADLLRSVDGIQTNTISLLLPDGQSQNVSVSVLGKEQTIFYISKNGTMKGATLGPGKIGLRITAEKIAGSRGVCKVSVLPIFSPLRQRSIPLLQGRVKTSEFLFTSAGFNLKMSPGDFVLLGPEKYDISLKTLDSLLFSKPEGSLFFNELDRKAPELKPAVRLFLLACTSINY
jgi:hypothetical protein